LSDLILYEKILPPEIPDEWNYDQSVEKVKRQIYKIRYMTKETVREIWIAHKKLSNQGARTDLTSSKIIRSWENYCNDIGITKQTAYNWFEYFGLKSPRRLVGKFTGDIENYTPEKVIASVREVLGDIDLDPASNLIAQDIIQAHQYYTEKEDGLKKEWHGRVFLNPPYKYPLIADFINKLIKEYQMKNVISAILLTNNNTDTRWFHEAANVSAVICFTNGRINFYKENKEKTYPTNGQTFFYYGNNEQKFIDIFKYIGFLVKIIE